MTQQNLCGKEASLRETANAVFVAIYSKDSVKQGLKMLLQLHHSTDWQYQAVAACM
jgi:hypothetical protein